MKAFSQTTVQSVVAPAQVNGRRLLVTLAAGAAASAALGATTWYGLRWFEASANPGGLPAQIVVAEVYCTLIAALVIAFGPLRTPPLAFRVTSARDIGLACLAWIGIVCCSLVVYLLLSPVAGSLSDVLEKILSLATDAKRLQTQPLSVWTIAGPRGCLIAPLFEELLFRGLLLEWLRKRLKNSSAIVVSAVLFAAMHAYPIVMPYAFLAGLFMGWVRIRTGSTFTTLIMHVFNNVLFLYLGLSLLR